MALGYAAIALSVLAVLLRVAVAYKLRLSNSITPYKVVGGNAAWVLVFSAYGGTPPRLARTSLKSRV